MRVIAAASREVARLQSLLRIRVMLCELFGRFYSPQHQTRTELSASTRGILTTRVTFSHRACLRHQSWPTFSLILKPHESQPSRLTFNYRVILIPNLYSVLEQPLQPLSAPRSDRSEAMSLSPFSVSTKLSERLTPAKTRELAALILKSEHPQPSSAVASPLLELVRSILACVLVFRLL